MKNELRAFITLDGKHYSNMPDDLETEPEGSKSQQVSPVMVDRQLLSSI
jgi:hypothetical protein